MHDIIPVPQVAVDAATAEKLHGLGQPMEFRDEAGNVLGIFQPNESSPAFRAWLRGLDHGLSDEEIERRFASSDGYSTEEVLKRLQGQNP
jgi:hypothetical protein